MSDIYFIFDHNHPHLHWVSNTSAVSYSGLLSKLTILLIAVIKFMVIVVLNPDDSDLTRVMAPHLYY